MTISCFRARCLIGIDAVRNSANTIAIVVGLDSSEDDCPQGLSSGSRTTKTRFAIAQSVSFAYIRLLLAWLKTSATVIAGTAALMPIRCARIDAMTMPPAMPVAPCRTPDKNAAADIASRT